LGLVHDYCSLFLCPIPTRYCGSLGLNIILTRNSYAAASADDPHQYAHGEGKPSSCTYQSSESEGAGHSRPWSQYSRGIISVVQGRCAARRR
ncbi:hypothetical protein WG66_008979, partial [Moniliophthora roreri]